MPRSASGRAPTRASLHAWVAVFVLAAGCLIGTPANPMTDAQADEIAGEVDYEAFVLWLHPDGSLSPDEPKQASTIPLAWGWRSWLEGTAPPSWEAAPVPSEALLTNVRLAVTYEAIRPAVTTNQRPELTAWWGADDRWPRHVFSEGPPAMLPGELAAVDYELEGPRGGMLLAAGERLRVSVGTYYADDAETATMGIRLGGPDGARVSYDAALGMRDGAQASSGESVFASQVSLSGGRCAGADDVTEADTWSTDLTLPIGAKELSARATRLSGTGAPDIDIALQLADGTTVARSQGPAQPERILLGAANLAALATEQLRFVVYNCTPQQSTVELAVDAHVPNGVRDGGHGQVTDAT